MPLEAPYEPIELDRVEVAFPANALDYMPEYEVCQDTDARPSYCLDLQQEWFLGIDDIQLIPADRSWTQEDIDRAFLHLNAIQCSFAPKHEHKEAAVAFLLERWFSYVRWKPKGKGEWRGEWPDELDVELTSFETEHVIHTLTPRNN